MIYPHQKLLFLHHQFENSIFWCGNSATYINLTNIEEEKKKKTCLFQKRKWGREPGRVFLLKKKLDRPKAIPRYIRLFSSGPFVIQFRKEKGMGLSLDFKKDIPYSSPTKVQNRGGHQGAGNPSPNKPIGDPTNQVMGQNIVFLNT